LCRCSQHHAGTVRRYSGRLYQVKRDSDGKTLDIGVVQPVESPLPDAGGYANAGAQDAFCAKHDLRHQRLSMTSPARVTIFIRRLRDLNSRPAKGAFDTQPIADMAPITISGHKAYGVFHHARHGIPQ
jgi:hypothetical protein